MLSRALLLKEKHKNYSKTIAMNQLCASSSKKNKFFIESIQVKNYATTVKLGRALLELKKNKTITINWVC